MQSNNPVFRRSEEFTTAGASTQGGYGQSGYTDPSTWSTGGPGGTSTTLATPP